MLSRAQRALIRLPCQALPLLRGWPVASNNLCEELWNLSFADKEDAESLVGYAFLHTVGVRCFAVVDPPVEVVESHSCFRPQRLNQFHQMGRKDEATAPSLRKTKDDSSRSLQRVLYVGPSGDN